MNLALLVPLSRGQFAELNAGIEVLKSSMDMEFCRDRGVAHREPTEFCPVKLDPIRDLGLLSQEES